jgi:hypothetical protein
MSLATKNIALTIPITSREIIDKIILIQEAIAIVDPEMRNYFCHPSKLCINLGTIRVKKEDIPTIKFAIKHVVASMDDWTPHIECARLGRKKAVKQGIESYGHSIGCHSTVHMQIMNSGVFQKLRNRLRIEFLKCSRVKKWHLWKADRQRFEENGYTILKPKFYHPIIPIVSMTKKKGYNGDYVFYTPNLFYEIEASLFQPWGRHFFGRQLNLKLQLVEVSSLLDDGAKTWRDEKVIAEMDMHSSVWT